MPFKGFRSGFMVKLNKEKQPSKTTNSGQDSTDEDCYRETTNVRKHAVVGELEETKTTISTYEKTSRYLFLRFYCRLSLSRSLPRDSTLLFFSQIKGADKARNFAK